MSSPGLLAGLMGFALLAATLLAWDIYRETTKRLRRLGDGLELLGRVVVDLSRRVERLEVVHHPTSHTPVSSPVREKADT